MIYVELWVQTHDLSLGLMSEALVRQFGSFLGSFLDYDAKILMYCAKRYMRIKVQLDVRLLLKRKKKLCWELVGWYMLGLSMKSFAYFVFSVVSLVMGRVFSQLGLIKLGSDGEECPIQFVDKKKRQRTLGVTSIDLFNGDVGVVGEGQDRSASSAMQGGERNENPKLGCL
ncbi:hypothetical protein Goshw_009504 [Gossypium schwendimanii]|uniref:Uncharacterized protein n=1 Tax=Gossypium schwendimanii TaxID=34291 RepID=A0A7J9LUR8_GOSSC|nr:hypothetical protein [Gossypium schwendimanii]